MPKIFEYFGMVFFFYANEHDPIHVHIKQGECENKVDLIFNNGILMDMLFKKVGGADELPMKKQKEAREFIEVYHMQIVEKWKEFFVLHIKPRNERITKL